MQSSRTTSAPLLLDVAVTHLAVNSCQKGGKGWIEKNRTSVDDGLYEKVANKANDNINTSSKIMTGAYGGVCAFASWLSKANAAVAA